MNKISSQQKRMQMHLKGLSIKVVIKKSYFPFISEMKSIQVHLLLWTFGLKLFGRLEDDSR